MSKEFSTPMEKLFGSKTRAKLLALFFEGTDKSYYVREITRVIEEQINSVRRELSNLESLGLIKNETYENKVYYSANTKHPFARPMSEIFSSKVELVRDKSVRRGGWEEYMKPVKNYLTALVVTNRVPGQEGLDMLIIGDDRTKKLSHWAEVVERKQGKPLNYVIMSREDYLYRKSVKDRFVTEVWMMEIAEKIDQENIL